MWELGHDVPFKRYVTVIHSRGGACGGAWGEREREGEVGQPVFSSVVRARRGGRQDGADGVDGADLGALHHGLPGDPPRQRLRIQRDHRRPGEDPAGSDIRRGVGAQGRTQSHILDFEKKKQQPNDSACLYFL